MSEGPKYTVLRTAPMCVQETQKDKWCHGELDESGRCRVDPQHTEVGEVDVEVECIVTSFDGRVMLLDRNGNEVEMDDLWERYEATSRLCAYNADAYGDDDWRGR